MSRERQLPLQEQRSHSLAVQRSLQATGHSYLGLGQQTKTDSSGGYRLSALAPGVYYIRVATANSQIRFYPSSDDAEQATKIPLRGGEEITGIDVEVR
jgi:hypothetical protein